MSLAEDLNREFYSRGFRGRYSADFESKHPRDNSGQFSTSEGGGDTATAPDRIRAWVTKQFNAKHVDQVTQDLIDVAAGNREGNDFEKDALRKIFPDWPGPKG